MSGFPSAQNTAPIHDRYVGMYYYDSYWRQWDFIVSVTDWQWIVQAVDLNGVPTGEVRKHCTPLYANRFAVKPFDVTYKDLSRS